MPSLTGTDVAEFAFALDVRPRASATCASDYVGIYTELFSQDRRRLRGCANTSHALVSQFRLRKLLAASDAPLSQCVLGVVLRSAKEQMGRVAARRVIATMADTKAMRDWSIHTLPRQAMGFGRLIVSAEKAVSVHVTQAAPLPTSITRGAPDSAGQSLPDRSAFDFRIATARTVALAWIPSVIRLMAAFACPSFLCSSHRFILSGAR